jgi:hypothetical protein
LTGETRRIQSLVTDLFQSGCSEERIECGVCHSLRRVVIVIIIVIITIIIVIITIIIVVITIIIVIITIIVIVTIIIVIITIIIVTDVECVLIEIGREKITK